LQDGIVTDKEYEGEVGAKMIHLLAENLISKSRISENAMLVGKLLEYVNQSNMANAVRKEDREDINTNFERMTRLVDRLRNTIHSTRREVMESIVEQRFELRALERNIKMQQGLEYTPDRPVWTKEVREHYSTEIASLAQHWTGLTNLTAKALGEHASKQERPTPASPTRPVDKKGKGQEGKPLEQQRQLVGDGNSPARKVKDQGANKTTPMEIDENNIGNCGSNDKIINDSGNNNILNTTNDSDDNNQRPLGHADSSGETDCNDDV
jgi:hypothetical protein